ncbi:Lob domain-containing protein [Thalictrum thalictroides]|uniref:Lob domain-containing protein n=1 Tax=Thalictrum thalictroides TaxID=46969 RepID=A0A7J6WPW1_THATH|nr:Lob domain-containing protein [Thalictrum thalictroides]
MTVKGGTNQACAACKYQRRKCSPDCALAPYFPPDQPRMFQNAHKLFGVSNILKVLKVLPPHQRKEAMRSIIMHANIRDKHPVYGCWGIVRDLEYQCQQLCMELNAVNAQLAICRQQYNHQFSESSPNNSPSSKLQLGQASPHHNNNSAALPLFQHCAPAQQQQSFNGTPTGNGISVFAPNQAAGLSYGNNVYDYNNAADYVETKDANGNSMWIQQQEQPYIHQNNNMNNNNYSAPIQSQFLVAEELPIKQQTVDDDPQDYDEIPAFFDIIDDRQSYIDSKEAYESSSDSSLKDTTTRSNIEQVSDNELKSAAACFSLTSIN